MPAFLDSSFVHEPARDIPIGESADVVVLGGGSAGLAAALAAARQGAQVVLLERYGFLGGNATTAGVVILHRFYPPESSEPVIAGIPLELMNKLVQGGWAVNEQADGRGDWIFDPAGFRCVADDLVEKAGIRTRFHTLACGAVVTDHRIRAVIVESKSGREAIVGKLFIDASGDGDLAMWAGEEYEKGRPGDQALQPPTLCFRVGGIDPTLADDSPIDAIPRDILKQPIEAGELPQQIANIATGVDVLQPGTGLWINGTRILGIDGTNVLDLTRAEFEGRRQVRQVLDVLCQRVPGFRNAYLLEIAPQVGVRETRRVMGRYVITEEDILTTRTFPDSIAQGVYRVDIHNPKGAGILFRYIDPAKCYQIPYRCLIPRLTENLLVVGRCMSATHEALGALRVMVNCMTTGQAAGTAAALALDSDVLPKDLDVTLVQKALSSQGAIPGC